ncbi:hypothetical protein [Neomegalonema sp.]|uniref:hypothetical protein n=1 Tax=Neomegalonema sp. TaxID=2039713 RepID=UPI002606063C|nr:hypothetical protein [Neomegalonema sp.]MDD2867978.1 hypothetical protein [Neomegalonema sp.]
MARILVRRNLEIRFSGLNRGESVSIAARNALRVNPILARAIDIQNFRSHMLQSTWRTLDAAIFYVEAEAVARRSIRTDRSKAAAHASAAARAACTVSAKAAADAISAISSRLHYAYVCTYAIDAATYTAHIATCTTDVASARADRAAADAAARAAAAAAARAATVAVPPLEAAITHDLSVLREGATPQALLASPLWPTVAPAWASEAWRALRTELDPLPGEHWSVWTDWYESRLQGRSIDWDLQRKRVMIPHEERLWDQGPAVVNARLKEIIAEHQESLEPRQPKPEDFPQDTCLPSFKDRDGGIDVDDRLLHPSPVPVDSEAKAVHGIALQGLQRMRRQFSPSNAPHMRTIAMLAEGAEIALGVTLQETNAPLTAMYFNLLELELEADDRRHKITNLQEGDAEHLPPEHRAKLEDPLIAYRLLTARDARLKAADDIARSGRAPAPVPEAVKELLKTGFERKVFSQRVVEIIRNAFGIGAEYGRQVAGNLLNAIASAGAATLQAIGAGKPAARKIALLIIEHNPLIAGVAALLTKGDSLTSALIGALDTALKASLKQKPSTS